jgi:cation transport protein ChaC
LPDEVAACLSEACGHWGSGAEYLLQTVRSLEREGFHDPYLWDLQERVAGLIEGRYPAADDRPEQNRSGQSTGSESFEKSERR